MYSLIVVFVCLFIFVVFSYCFFLGLLLFLLFVFFFFQAEDGIRDLVRSRGLGDVYKRQAGRGRRRGAGRTGLCGARLRAGRTAVLRERLDVGCLLYTSDAADDLLCVDLGGRRIIKKKRK